MRHDRGGSAHRQRHAISQQFAFARKFVRKSIKNQIEIHFACNSDVKSWHPSPSSFWLSLVNEDSKWRERGTSKHWREKQGSFINLSFFNSCETFPMITTPIPFND